MDFRAFLAYLYCDYCSANLLSEFSVYFCSSLYSSLATYLKKKKGVLPTFHIVSVLL